MSYLLISDLHFHNWSAFASVNDKGINSRLQITINEVKRALDAHQSKGGDKNLIIAGDLFHTRGAVQTSVLNPVVDLFREIKSLGWDVQIISGNHDLESKESSRLSSAVTMLEEFCVGVYNTGCRDSYGMGNQTAFMPWVSEIPKLKERLEILASTSDVGDFDLIMHAPVDGVIMGLPNHGIDAKYLSELGFKRVFAGHYHHHKNLGNNVWSIGATTHQTFGDIGSKAGFLSVFDDEVVFHASHAPKFIDINADNYDDAELLVDGNYVRCRINVAKESDVALLREQFFKWGAKGVVINQIKDITAKREEKVMVSSSPVSLEGSVANFVAAKGYGEAVEKACLDILNEVEVSE